MEDMKKVLSEGLENEFKEKLDKALDNMVAYHEGYLEVKTSANLHAVIKPEEFQKFDELGHHLCGLLGKALDRYDEKKYYEAALLLTKAAFIKDDINAICRVVSDRLEEEENSNEIKHVNVPYIMFITKFDDEVSFNYYETMSVIESDCSHYISWIDEHGVRRFAVANSKIDAMQMAMAKGLGRDSVYCKYQ